MAWVKMLKNHDWFPTEHRTPVIAYRGGVAYNVTRDCRDEMIAAGAAKGMKTPKKGRSRVR